jgi:cytidine deaminase
MAIEVIAPGLVRVNGYFVELVDQREPDIFDREIERYNDALASTYAQPLTDSIVSLRNIAGLRAFDPLYAAYQQVPRFIETARRSAAEKAVSYRDFKVGASACAIDDEGLRMGYFFGANYKPTPQSGKYCAELDVVNKARQAQFNRIVALAVFGPSEFADVDPLPSPTLHPCSVCRDMLQNDPLFDDDLLIITTNKEGATELFTRNELISLHNTA